MACGCTEVSHSGLVSQPTPPGQPAPSARNAPAPKAAQRVEVAQRELKSAAREVARAATPAALDRHLGKAKSALTRARQAKAPKAEVRRLESELRELEQAAKDKSDKLVYEQMKSAAHAVSGNNEVQAALHLHRAQNAAARPASRPAAAPSSAERASREAASKWGAEYEEETGNALVDIPIGSLTYTFDTFGERLVCVTGTTNVPAARNYSRQQGSPKPSEEGDEKGHVIANCLGGGMDINLVPQARSTNRGKDSRWSAIERELAERPGSAVAIHLVYTDDSQRPASFEFGHESDAGFQIEPVDNPKSF